MMLPSLFRRLFPLLCLSLVGCSLIPSELQHAEHIMETTPDSALHILLNVKPNDQRYSTEDKALYGLLLFQALDKNKLDLQPDSVINFSISYYQTKGNKPQLAKAYFYKARMYKNAQLFDEATILYLKALDNTNKNNDADLLGKIYADMGDMCAIQEDYKASRAKYLLSVNFYSQASKPIEASNIYISIGRTYRYEKNYTTAHKYYLQAFKQTNDSITCGVAFQEVGINYYNAAKYDSALHYLNKCMKYPFYGTNYSIRCFQLADVYFDTEQYDSAFHYATIALKYPANIATQRECYRLLANTEYLRKDFEKMAVYMTHYQSCTDSVSKLQAQTKTTVLEEIHKSSQSVNETKSYLYILMWAIPIIIIAGLLVLFLYRKRNKGKELLLEQQLNEKQQLLNKNKSLLKDNLLKKIEENKALHSTAYKKATSIERDALTIALYSNCLHLGNWEKFSELMNYTFNNIIDTLKNTHPDITQRELTWCCLNLLNIQVTEMALVLECKAGSLYKLKGRLAIKMDLNSTKDLDALLESLSEQK